MVNIDLIYQIEKINLWSFQNEYCLSVLDYDTRDVIEILKKLTPKEYSRTLIAHEDKNKNVYSYEFR